MCQSVLHPALIGVDIAQAPEPLGSVVLPSAALRGRGGLPCFKLR